MKALEIVLGLQILVAAAAVAILWVKFFGPASLRDRLSHMRHDLLG